MNLNLGLLLPEWILSGFLILLVLREILTPVNSDHNKTAPLAIAFSGALAALIGILLCHGKIGDAFNGIFIVDAYALFFKAFFALTTLVVLQMARTHFDDDFKHFPEFCAIVLCTLLGLFFLTSSNDFLLMFISLEIVTLSFYIMTAYAKNEIRSIEAGLKYLVIGSLASAFVIFGISLIYTAVGSTHFADVRIAFGQNTSEMLILLGLLMVLAGLGFKTASFPFQFWVPDVYEGAPTPVVAFLSVASKAAGFSVLLRIMFSVFGHIGDERILLFSLVGTATPLYGNLGALLQTNIKRLLGYSSIGHAGYLLLGVAAGGTFGKAAILYYLMAYAF